MTTALAKLRDQIEEAFVNNRPWEGKATRLQRGLRRKFARLVRPEIARLTARPWTVDRATFVNNHLDDEVVALLLLPTADLRFFLAQLAGRTSLDIVLETPRGPGVECFRDATTLLINAEGQEDATKSWSRCISISKSAGTNAYAKHLYEANYNGRVAKYGVGVVPKIVEAKVVRQGLGHLDGEDRLFLYGRFATAVGMTGRGNARAETDFLKVQLDRVPRPRVTRPLKSGGTRRRLDGWEVHMHGYPITEQELRIDFPAGAARVSAEFIP